MSQATLNVMPTAIAGLRRMVTFELCSSEAHQNQMMQLLANPSKAANFARIVFDLLVQGQAGLR
jgi:hypothetical protein